MKKWVTIMKYSVYEIQILDKAGVNDDMNYRIYPALPGDKGEASPGYLHPETAVEAINARGVMIVQSP